MGFDRALGTLHGAGGFRHAHLLPGAQEKRLLLPPTQGGKSCVQRLRGIRERRLLAGMFAFRVGQGLNGILTFFPRRPAL